jgi:hypothetical protein
LPALIAYESPKLYAEAHRHPAEWAKAQPARRISGRGSDVGRVTGVPLDFTRRVVHLKAPVIATGCACSAP